MVEIFAVLGQKQFDRLSVPLRTVFMQNTSGQAMYNSDFCFTCLGLAIVLYEAESGRKADQSFCQAALFLHVPHSPNIQYDRSATIERFKSELDAATINIMREQAEHVPPSELGRSIGDAAMLALMLSKPQDLIKFVVRNTQQSKQGAVKNLVRVFKEQRMFTQIGRSILNEIRPRISRQLEESLNEQK